jgi:hypothetical protein
MPLGVVNTIANFKEISRKLDYIRHQELRAASLPRRDSINSMHE